MSVEGADSVKAVTLPGPEGFDEYYTRHLGKISFPKAGMYTVKVRPADNLKKELFGLNWLFVE